MTELFGTHAHAAHSLCASVGLFCQSASAAPSNGSSAVHSPVSTDPSSHGTSPVAPTDGTHALPRRKLSASAREFTPTESRDGILQYPAAAQPAPISEQGEFLQPDDAEDEEELQVLVDATAAAAATSTPGHRDITAVMRVLTRAVEFYFSNQNLWQDVTLREEMAKDLTQSGYVPLSVVLQLKKVHALTSDPSLLVCAIKQSAKLVLSPDATQVKRVTPLVPYDEMKDSNRTIFIDRLPPHSTVASVKQLFSRFGRVMYVLRADHIIPGLEPSERGKLTPHTSPKVKSRSLSDAGRLSPSLQARKLAAAAAAGTPGASPALTGISGPSLTHLSPAQRNRVIAATAGAPEPDTFTAAFIQFAVPACAKKAISHIVAYNKQLKAMTPKGSPRIPLARRASHGGLPLLPNSALGGSQTIASVPEGAASTPPRSRTIRVLSQQQSPLANPANALTAPPPSSILTTPQRNRAQEHSPSPEPPGVPPRHSHSPAPHVGPLSPPLVQERVTSPPPARKLSAADAASPSTTPLIGSMHARNGDMSELSLGSPSHAGLAAPNQPLVTPLPSEFIGMFTMPKVSYLKSLKTRPGEAKPKSPTSALTSPVLMAIGSPAHKASSHILVEVTPTSKNQKAKQHAHEHEKKNGGQGKNATATPVQTSTSLLKRDTPSSPLAPLALAGPPTVVPTMTTTTTITTSTAKLSASAPVFQPNPSFQATVVQAPAQSLAQTHPPATIGSPQMAKLHPSSGSPKLQGHATPKLQGATSSPKLQASSHSPPVRALKGNWRSGETPLAAAAQHPTLSEPMEEFSLAPPALTAQNTNTNTAATGGEKKAKQPKQQQQQQQAAKKKTDTPEGDAAAATVAASHNKTEGALVGGTISSPSLGPVSASQLDRPRFSLTSARRQSVPGVPERQVVSRFALGPSAPDAVGFGGRGRTMQAQQPSMVLPPAGGGKPIAS